MAANTHTESILPQTAATKADLGKVRPGVTRNPKKSAKLLDGQASTAGSATLWGDPERASHIVTAEGIETGAALAYAFREEIKNDDIAVAASISAKGIESFQPWPNTKLVTVAADRDERRRVPDTSVVRRLLEPSP